MEKVHECGKKRFLGKRNVIHQRKVGPKGAQVHAGGSQSAQESGDPRREKRGRDLSASVKVEQNHLREGGRDCRPSGLNSTRRGRNMRGRHQRNLGSRRSQGVWGRRGDSYRDRLRECIVTREISVGCRSIIIIVVGAVCKAETQ